MQTRLGSEKLIRELIVELHGWVCYFRELPLAKVSVDDRLCGARVRTRTSLRGRCREVARGDGSQDLSDGSRRKKVMGLRRNIKEEGTGRI